jgi:hypothetical protein
MGITWMELHSDDLPAHVVHDYVLVLQAEQDYAEKQRQKAERDAKRRR